MRRTDPLIAGGGPAGAAAAIALAAAGARPLMLERARGDEAAVCGAFLSWDTLASLDRLGVDPWALGARPIGRVRIVRGTQVVERALPHRAAGLSRRRLDAALRARAVAAGAGLERGVTVRAATATGVRLADGTLLETDSLFLATGKHALRGSPRDGAPAGQVGLRTSVPGTPDLADTIELHLFAGGYAGLLMQEDGSANLCLSVAPARLAAAGDPAALVAALAQEAPRLAARLAAGRGDWSAIAAVPYGWRAPGTTPGRFRIGDQAAVIASLAGDGMGIALASATAAAAAWARGGAAAAPAYQARFTRRAARPLAVAEALRAAAERPWLGALVQRLLALAPGGMALAAHATRIGH